MKTPQTLTADDIREACGDGLCSFIDAWDALGDDGSAKQERARNRICDAINKGSIRSYTRDERD